MPACSWPWAEIRPFSSRDGQQIRFIDLDRVVARKRSRILRVIGFDERANSDKNAQDIFTLWRVFEIVFRGFENKFDFVFVRLRL